MKMPQCRAGFPAVLRLARSTDSFSKKTLKREKRFSPRWTMNGTAKSERVAVFGASGLVGREVVAAALRRGLQVQALYRPGSEPLGQTTGLEAITGQLTDSSRIQKTLEGTMGAICVFGPRLGRKNSPQPFCADATERIVEEMKKLRIERLIVQTGAMAGGDSPNWSWFVRRFVKSYRKNYPQIDKDRDAQETVTKGSGLDWTITRTFRISGGGGTGKVRALDSARISFFTHTPRGDFANFLLDELLNGTHHRKTIYVVK
jgi:putative NADH-flavin reductase